MKKTALILSIAVMGFAMVGCGADKSGDTQQMPATGGAKKSATGVPGLPPQAQDAFNKAHGTAGGK